MEGMSENFLAKMLKDFLLSDGDSTATDTARLIDNFYGQVYLPSDPLMKFEDGQGIETFLVGFYELIFALARFIPYNSSDQDKVVQLMLELRKLPPKQLRIWEVCQVLLCAVLNFVVDLDTIT